MKIDIWSDIVCPYCYLGKRRLEAALAQFEHADEVEVQWHSFELDRGASPVSDVPLVDLVAAKYGTTREQAVAQHRSMAAAAAELTREHVGTDYELIELDAGHWLPETRDAESAAAILHRVARAS